MKQGLFIIRATGDSASLINKKSFLMISEVIGAVFYPHTGGKT